jgi:muramoyltetrapeptide carboxypeptidase
MTHDRRQFLRTTTLAAAGLMTACAQAQPSEKFESEKGLLLPPRLKKGDLVALTAPAGAIFNEDSIQKATLALEGAGFRVKAGETLKQRFGYLAGEDSFRANELNALFSDKEVKGIVAMRGGWGCARLLKLLDFKTIAANPKILSGFSDITTLLLAIYAKTGLVTFHGPVGNSSWEEFTMEHFLSIVENGDAAQLQQPAADPVNILSPGKATGRLLGGNLVVLCSLLGTDFLPDFTGALLFLEETEEEPYAIDRLLTQLQLSGVLDKVNGVIFGKCAKCEAEEPEKSFTLDEVLRQKFSAFGKPVISGFSFGHVKDKFTVPVGIQATLDTGLSQLNLSQPCVNL